MRYFDLHPCTNTLNAILNPWAVKTWCFMIGNAIINIYIYGCVLLDPAEINGDFSHFHTSTNLL